MIQFSYISRENHLTHHGTAKYITEDGSQYVCYTDGDGRLNFSFGVMHYNGSNFALVEQYASLGIDITQYGYVGATLDVEIVDKVMLMEIEEKRQSVVNKISAAGITLSGNQIDALTAVAYQWGQSIIDAFITVYQQYGDTDELRYNFHSLRDTADYPFYTGNATDGVPSESAKRRGEANWAMFHEGRYILKDGTVLNASDYAESDLGNLVGQNQNGIYGLYTASSGKTFIEYRQMAGASWGIPPWASVPYWGGTIATDGCGPTAAAIALTGYGVNVTPEDTANAISNHFGSGTSTTPNTLTWVVNNFGVSAHTDGWKDVTADKLANNLRQGRPVLISVSDEPDDLFTSSGHLMALLDINSNNEVYVSNPSTKATGWFPLSTVIQYCDYKWAVYFDE